MSKIKDTPLSQRNGYVVDKIADLLHAHGIECMQIVLGDEALVRGQPGKRSVWSITIPSHVASLINDASQITLELADKAVVAASKAHPKMPCPTNIVDAYVDDPVQDPPLLAAVVVSKDCSTADAYATAIMARGMTFAQELLAKQKELAAFLIYEDDHGAPVFYISPNLHMQQDAHNIILQSVQEVA